MGRLKRRGNTSGARHTYVAFKSRVGFPSVTRKHPVLDLLDRALGMPYTWILRLGFLGGRGRGPISRTSVRTRLFALAKVQSSTSISPASSFFPFCHDCIHCVSNLFRWWVILYYSPRNNVAQCIGGGGLFYITYPHIVTISIIIKLHKVLGVRSGFFPCISTHFLGIRHFWFYALFRPTKKLASPRPDPVSSIFKLGYTPSRFHSFSFLAFS